MVLSAGVKHSTLLLLLYSVFVPGSSEVAAGFFFFFFFLSFGPESAPTVLVIFSPAASLYFVAQVQAWQHCSEASHVPACLSDSI